jgi:hypothetical protein
MVVVPASARRTTIADVAALARVSPTTVSNVLNRPVVVRSATRDRVLDAIRVLDFTRDPVARALRTGARRDAVLVHGTADDARDVLELVAVTAGIRGGRTLVVPVSAARFELDPERWPVVLATPSASAERPGLLDAGALLLDGVLPTSRRASFSWDAAGLALARMVESA